MRLDKFLSQLNMGSRNDVKALIRQGKVTVNDKTETACDRKIDEAVDRIVCNGQPLHYSPYVYYMMNKPAGVVSATTDRAERTVLDLLRPLLPTQDQKRELVPVGRLDKDTEGLLLLTDDGALAHRMLAPKKHVDKTYLVTCALPLSDASVCALENGVEIGEKQPTLPARVTRVNDTVIYLTIHEGKFHQVKRMLTAVDNQVCALKRVQFGPLQLDDTLASGASRALTAEEIRMLQALK